MKLEILRLVAQALLPVLLVLYPLLLLLDDLEPGFVRSVVNPHWFLVAMIVVGMIVGRANTSPSLRQAGAPPLAPPLREGEKKTWPIVIVCVAAVVVGFWVWWRVGGGMLGMVVGILAAVAIVAVVWGVERE
ncbi:hypothetical protein HY635_00505 [Candidatus Uhrbacteria bacterium]|nr:hypothetical protein [Candidatus Uhrbacteria bacterium]